MITLNRKQADMTILNKLRAAVFPDRCCFCGKVILHRAKICKKCRETVKFISRPICHSCGLSKKDCKCNNKKHFYTAVTVAFVYEGVVKHGIRLWKFRNHYRSVSFFAETIAISVKKSFPDERFDVITYIPQTESEMKTRAYNQGQILANEVGKLLHIPVETLLIKLYDTERQHNMPHINRSGNVFGVFDVCNIKMTENKKILLIDDIKTSGQTLDECAKMLRLYNAQSVHCAVIATTKSNKNAPS